MKKCILIALCFILVLAAGCAPQTAGTQSSPASQSGAEPEQQQNLPPWAPDPNADPVPDKPPWEREPKQTDVRPLSELTENTIKVTITMEDGGVIEAELYPDLAPQTVRNFVHLARLGFYDGLKFHRIMSGFMIQGGCPDSKGTGNAGYSIWGEFALNGFVNELKHKPGVLSTARGGDPYYNSAGSQFFIMHGTSSGLDGKYAGFGMVTSGMDVVDKIAATPNSGPDGAVAAGDMPVIKSIVVNDTTELPAPEKIPR